MSRGRLDHSAQTAVIRGRPVVNRLNLSFYRGHPGRKLRVKLEIAVEPPECSGWAYTHLDFPTDFEVCHQDLPGNFALKIHALLCRDFVKGRDRYDFNWYVKRGVSANVLLLSNALTQAGPWAGQHLAVDMPWLKVALQERITGIDWKQAADDGHRWLNVPYDSGYAFVRDHELLAKSFRYSADYLPPADDPRPAPGAIGPESSRRARGFAVWATLKAYGKQGQRCIVEHCPDNAQYPARRVEDSLHLELMADVPLNIVAFRFNPGGGSAKELDAFNRQLGEAVLADGQFLVGTSKPGHRTIFRPAFSNWRVKRAEWYR